MHYVASSGFALSTDHGGAFGDPTQGFAQIASAAHKRNFEGVLVDVVGFVGGREHLGFVDVIDAEFLEYLGFRKMADAALSHHGNGNRRHNFANLFRRCHTGHTAFGANLRRHGFEGHAGDCTASSGAGGLLVVAHVHD